MTQVPCLWPLTALLIAGCSGGADPTDDREAPAPSETAAETASDTGAPAETGTPAPGSDDPVAEQLLALGVDPSPSPRLDHDAAPLPEDYAPLGASQQLDVRHELALVGLPLSEGSGFADAPAVLLELDRPDKRPQFNEDVRFAMPTPKPAWDLTASATGDVDGDGLQELVVLYREVGDPTVWGQVVDDEEAAFAVGARFVVSTSPVHDVVVAGADPDGDGRFGIAVAQVTDEGITVAWLDGLDGTPTEAASRTIRAKRPDSTRQVSMAAAQLDYDRGQELVLTVNERSEGYGPSAQQILFDDAGAGFAELRRAPVRGDLDQLNRAAVVADVAVGDVDQDGLDEIVLGGLTNLDPDDDCDADYLLVILDDLAHGGDTLAVSDASRPLYGGCDAEAPGRVDYVHVNLLDIDGDDALELAANELVFDDLVSTPAFTPLEAPLTPTPGPDQVGEVELPLSSLFAGSEGAGLTGVFDPTTASIEVGEVTGDDRDDLLVYSAATGRLEVWGLSDPGEEVILGQWARMHTIDVGPVAPGIRPAVVPTNPTPDGMAIAFDDGSYQLVFTEPILIAALAAAPCDEALGQREILCRTAYGEVADYQSQQRTATSINGQVTVGFKVGGNLFEVEGLRTLKAKASWATTETYRRRKYIVYTTGPVEDTVILTTVPLDQYTYTVTAHPDKKVVGRQIVVSLPREPVTVQVERGYYNANVVEGGPLIDESVFLHELRNAQSYPTAADKDALIGNSGLEVGPRTVGRSEGVVTQQLKIYEATTDTSTWGVGFETSLKVTGGGAVGGFSVGTSIESSLAIVHGEELIYRGAVADMSEEAFVGQSFDWGMFAYVHEDAASGQQFEVVNYWVE